MNFMPRPQGEA